MPNLAFELGLEELPYTELTNLSAQLRAQVEQRLQQQRLNYARLHEVATPRRLGLVLEQFDARQADSVSERKGPAWQQAFDSEGQPSKAALGFARSCGVALEQLERSADDRLLFRQQIAGKAARDLIPGLLAEAVGAITARKSMRWRLDSTRFSRPLRWLLLLLDDEVLPLSLLGCSADRHTSGHRLMAPEPLAIATASDYLPRLEREGKLIAGFAARQRALQTQVDIICARQQLQPSCSEDLYQTITALVELPQANLCRFPERFLQLPDELLRSVLVGHQKYIPLARPQGELSNCFIAVNNNPEGDQELIDQGHQRVVRPRLEDASFFLSTDQQRGLEDMAASLGQLSFARGLGSMQAKSERIAALLAPLCAQLECDELDTLQAAARLAKADLLSNLVQEFPELQGYAGAHLARLQGLDSAIATAIEQHYAPRGRDDTVPAMPAALLALADRLDSLAAFFSVGKKPSSSADPYSLRRAALGAIRIVETHALPLDLTAIWDAALQPLVAEPERRADVQSQLEDFLTERLRALWVETGFAADEVRAVLARAPTAIAQQRQRLQALARWRQDQRGQQLLEIYKRINNICADHAAANRTSWHLDNAAPADANLQSAYAQLQAGWEQLDSEARLQRLLELGPALARFFEEVMVLAPEPELRQLRLDLLAAIRAAFDSIADFAELVG